MLGAMVLSSPLAYVTMRRGAVFTYTCGLFGVVLIMLVALTLPETHRLLSSDQDEQAPAAAEVSLPNVKARVFSSLQSAWQSLKSLVAENTRLRLPLAVTALTTLGNYHASTMMQFITKRFGVSWGEVGLPPTGYRNPLCC